MKHKMTILKAVAILFLLVAVAAHPAIGFYTLLRWIICLIAVGSGVWAWRHHQPVWIGLFAVIAIIFNPLTPFYLPRETWAILDVAAIVTFAVSLIRELYT